MLKQGSDLCYAIQAQLSLQQVSKRYTYTSFHTFCTAASSQGTNKHEDKVVNIGSNINTGNGMLDNHIRDDTQNTSQGLSKQRHT